MPFVNGKYQRPQLRNGNINYSFGWFFVTFQVAGNKSELGAIVGESCVLNELGEAVKRLIETLGDFNEGVFVDCFVVMPNHVHLVLKIERGAMPSHPENRLGKLIGKLKSLAAREYRLLKEKRLARDIGSKLWQANYWEKIVTSHDQLEAIRLYIANNPKNWSTDRFGPVTTHSLGNLELLAEPFVTFVASQEGRAEALEIRRLGRGMTPSHPENILKSGAITPRPVAPRHDAGCPVISTFTSAQEREVLRRLLAKERRFIAVYPGGIPEVLPREIARSVEAGRALLLSPVESGTGVNKQRAVWCNEYVIRRASEVWCGTIKRGGTLESILKGEKHG